MKKSITILGKKFFEDSFCYITWKDKSWTKGIGSNGTGIISIHPEENDPYIIIRLNGNPYKVFVKDIIEINTYSEEFPEPKKCWGCLWNGQGRGGSSPIYMCQDNPKDDKLCDGKVTKKNFKDDKHFNWDLCINPEIEDCEYCQYAKCIGQECPVMIEHWKKVIEGKNKAELCNEILLNNKYNRNNKKCNKINISKIDKEHLINDYKRYNKFGGLLPIYPSVLLKVYPEFDFTEYDFLNEDELRGFLYSRVIENIENGNISLKEANSISGG